jgi:peptidoglycan/LPS O-acetylase OafA/YrhL
MLRSLAVSVVLVDHLLVTVFFRQGLLHKTVLEYFAFHLSQAGVLAFFVHTSLVLMYSLERMARDAHRVTLRFYVRRFFRIYPLSVVCVLLVIFFHMPADTWGDGNGVITVHAAVSNLLLIQNVVWKGDGSILAPLWSLPYEVQMYLVLPVLYFLTLRKRAVTYLIGLFLVVCMCSCLYHWKLVGHLGDIEFVPCFLSGVICYSLRDRIKARIPAFFWLPAVMLLIAVYCLVGGSKGTGNFWVAWVFCLLLGLAINFFRDSTEGHVNFAVGKIALYSYSVYLIHIPVFYFVFTFLGIRNSVLASTMSIALMMVGSVAAYHLIESPFIEMGRRLSTRTLRAKESMVAPGVTDRAEVIHR